MINIIEKKSKSVAVWLVLSDGVNINKVAMQRRTEKDGGEEQSFPHVFQPTWNGKMERGENIEATIRREAVEELCPNFKIPELTLFYKARYTFEGKLCTAYNYSGFVSGKELLKAKIHSAAEPNFYFLGKEDLLKIKVSGEGNSDPKKDIVLFKDQYEAIKKLFLG